MKSISEILGDEQEKRPRLPTSSLYAEVCQTCLGSGFADNQFGENTPIEEINFCSCPAGLKRKVSLEVERSRKHSRRLIDGCDAAGIPPKYRKFPLVDLQESGKKNKSAIAAASILANGQQIAQGGRTKDSLFLYGENGCGKTTLGAAILMERINAGEQALFVRGSKILDEVQDTYNGTGSKVHVLDKYRNTPWLMIDELVEGFIAKELTPDKIAILSEVISERYDWERPTIITSNLTTDELVKLLRTPKLADRINEKCVVMQMFGNHRL